LESMDSDVFPYRLSKHEITQVIPAVFWTGFEFIFGSVKNPDNYVRNLQEKLDEIHQDVRDRMEMKSNRVKKRYDKKEIVFSNKVKKSGFIILEERKGKLLNCRKIGKVHMK